MRISLTLILAIIVNIGTILANGTKIGDLYYELDIDSKTAKVTYESFDKIYEWWYNKGGNIVTATIPSSVTYRDNVYSVVAIGKHAFDCCFMLKSVTIPNSVISIEKEAFAYCHSLTSIKIPNSVISIGQGAFRDCKGLTTITIPENVQTLGLGGTFQNCSGLKSVVWNAKRCTMDISSSIYPPFNSVDIQIFTFGDSVEIIPPYLCVGIAVKSLTIPNSVKDIGEGAFCDLKNLITVTIPNSVTIGESAFARCPNLTSVTIPSSVTSIGKYAFWDCTNLTSVSIPNSVTSIDKYAFAGCTNLTSVTIPNSVTSIGDRAFSGCSNLTSITIPRSVTSIDDFAFPNSATSLTAINVDKANPKYCDINGVLFDKDKTQLIHYPCSKPEKEYIIPKSVQSIGEYAFYGCTNLTSVTIPSSVTSIGDCAFRDCSNLTSVTIPRSVTSISERTFDGCTNLTSVTIPNSVTSIGDFAFYGCSNLTSITIPGSVISIGEFAFMDCFNLTSITIPRSVTSIGKYAFFRCNLNEIHYPIGLDLSEVSIPTSTRLIAYDNFFRAKYTMFKKKCESAGHTIVIGWRYITERLRGHTNSKRAEK